MNLQDKIQYNAFLLGINDLYIPLSNNCFYINSPCIRTERKIVKIGNAYVLIHLNENSRLGFKEVKLLDVNCDSFNIILHVEEKYSEAKLDLEFNFLRSETQATWRLIEIDDVSKSIDVLIRDEYCRCE